MLKEKIKELRLKNGLTQAQLGEKLGVSAQAVSKWEKGETAASADILPALADVFGVNIDTLFGYTHDYSADIRESLCGYMQSVESGDAVSAARDLAAWIILGAKTKKFSESGNYSEASMGEIAAEWRKLIEAHDNRPQYFHHEEALDMKQHDIQNGSLVNYDSADLKLVVFQEYNEGEFQRILEGYSEYRDLFAFLGREDADKLLKLRYSEQMPSDFTAEYLAQLSGASLETVNDFLRITDCERLAQEATLKGRKTLIYTKPTTSYSQTKLQTVIAAAYAMKKDWRGHR